MTTILLYYTSILCIMLMGEIYYKLLNFISFLFPNMYISSCITCLYVYKLEIKFDLILLERWIIPNDVTFFVYLLCSFLL